MADNRRTLAATASIDLTGLRWAGGAMVGLGVVLPLLPHNPGLPCPLRTLTGVPCPFCGMTTSVKATLAGHLGSAVSANPFGIVAVVIALALLALPRWRRATVPWIVIAGWLALSWGWELHRFGFV